MYKNKIPLTTLIFVFVLSSYSTTNALQVSTTQQSTPSVHITNNYTLEKILSDVYDLATLAKGVFGLTNIVATSSLNISGENTIILNRSKLINFTSANRLPTESNANKFYFLSKDYGCMTNKAGLYIFSFDENGIICGTKLIAIKNKKDIFTMKYNESYKLLASGTIMIVNQNIKDQNNFTGADDTYYINTNSIYSKNKVEPYYTDNSTSSLKVTGVTDSWTISEGAQGLTLIKDSRRYIMGDGTTRVDTYDSVTGAVKVASTTVSQAMTPVVTNTKVVDKAPDNKAPTKALTVAISTSSDDIVANKPPLTTMELILSVLMFWK